MKIGVEFDEVLDERQNDRHHHSRDGRIRDPYGQEHRHGHDTQQEP